MIRVAVTADHMTKEAVVQKTFGSNVGLFFDDYVILEFENKEEVSIAVFGKKLFWLVPKNIVCRFPFLASF